MPRPPSDLEQISIRVPRAWLDEAEQIALNIRIPGHTVSRADVLRMALFAGLSKFKEEGLTSAKEPIE